MAVKNNPLSKKLHSTEGISWSLHTLVAQPLMESSRNAARRLDFVQWSEHPTFNFSSLGRIPQKSDTLAATTSSLWKSSTNAA